MSSQSCVSLVCWRGHEATHVKALGTLAQSGVVLLDKVPANLILWDFRGRCLLRRLAGGGLLGWCKVRGASSVAVFVALWRIVAIDGAGRLGGCHSDDVGCGWRGDVESLVLVWRNVVGVEGATTKLVSPTSTRQHKR